MPAANPMQTKCFAFVEFCSPKPKQLAQQLTQLGFTHSARHQHKQIDLYTQGAILFFINGETGVASDFANAHGASACGMGFMVEEAQQALQHANLQGAPIASNCKGSLTKKFPTLVGVGNSLLYLVDEILLSEYLSKEFNTISDDSHNISAGLCFIDHLTHNLKRGDMNQWMEYYQKYFNFEPIRSFDIRGNQTGLISHAMGSPEGNIRIPLNEGTEEASQIEEFIRQFNGPGIQHIALSTENIYETVETLRTSGIKFLEVPATYYEMIDERIPWQAEDVARLQKNEILIDGEKEPAGGLLLQIFTQNMLGPVFF